MTLTKVRGHEPQRPSAKPIGENADQDHRELMIEAAKRVHKSVREPARAANANMGQGRCRNMQKASKAELTAS